MFLHLAILIKMTINRLNHTLWQMMLITKITKILYLNSSIISLEVIVVVKSSITIAKISLRGILTSKSPFATFKLFKFNASLSTSERYTILHAKI